MTLITPLLGIVHFKTKYNYRLSNHCFINELIFVTYALISNAVEKKQSYAPDKRGVIWCVGFGYTDFLSIHIKRQSLLLGIKILNLNILAEKYYLCTYFSWGGGGGGFMEVG